MSWMFSHLGFFDVFLIAAVSALGTFAAYLRDPLWKSFLIILPVPFTLATLALGSPVGASNVAALFLLQMFYYSLVWLHRRRGVNIIVSIAVSASGYCLAGMLALPLLPSGEWFFWCLLAALEVFALSAYLRHPIPRDEGHRTSLHPCVKVPIIAAVVFVIVSVKSLMQGFMPLFPMVGVVASYEGRRSLGTMCRQNLFFLSVAGPMFAAIFLAQKSLGVHWGLALGWAVYLAELALTRRLWMPGAAGRTRGG